MPRPLHGWRVFAGEVSIIVFGVLIALGAEQIAQDFHDRAEAGKAREAIRGELEVNMARLASRSAVGSCTDRRLSEIQALLDRAQANGVVQTPKWVGRAQFWTMQTTRWDASSQSGRAALLPPDELAVYGLMHSWMHNIHADMEIEQGDWAKLRTLERLKHVTPEALFELEEAVQAARFRHWRVKQMTRQLLGRAADLRLKVVDNPIPAPKSVCVAMDTPRDEAIRQAGSVFGEP